MNCRDAFSECTVHGHIGWVRLDWRAEPFKVRRGNKNGPVEYFASAAEAELAAWRLKHKIETRVMVRDGPKIGDPTEGDRVLAKLGGVSSWVKQRGRDKQIKVETVRRARG